jgi:hypothetical protein
MTFLKYFHAALVTFFAAINGVMLYLFLLWLPYGVEAFQISLEHWDKLSPRIETVSTVAFVAALLALALVLKVSVIWKNRLLYLRMRYPHPAFNVFLNNRKQPFEASEALSAYPEVKDSGFNLDVQMETWERIHARHGSEPVILNTRIHWQMLRDLFLVSLFFAAAFLLGWLSDLTVPFEIISTYLFVFGAQLLFLFIAARRVGVKFADNVVAIGIGKKPEEQGLGRKKKRS